MPTLTPGVSSVLIGGPEGTNTRSLEWTGSQALTEDFTIGPLSTGEGPWSAVFWPHGTGSATTTAELTAWKGLSATGPWSQIKFMGRDGGANVLVANTHLDASAGFKGMWRLIEGASASPSVLTVMFGSPWLKFEYDWGAETAGVLTSFNLWIVHPAN